MTLLAGSVPQARHRLPGLHAAAIAAAVAGLLHLAVVPGHMAGSLLAGGFFLVVGCSQILLGAVLVVQSPGTRALAAVAVAHVLLVALYVATRTADLPFVPVHTPGGHLDATDVAAAAPGGLGNGVPVYPGSRTEPVGALDLACVLAEVVLVALLVGRLGQRSRTLVLDAALIAGAVVVLLRVTG